MMAQKSIDRLIINSPYDEPGKHWKYDREKRTFSLKDGRRPAGYVIASESSKAFDDPGIFVEIPLVQHIRPRGKPGGIMVIPASRVLQNDCWSTGPTPRNSRPGASFFAS